MTARHPWIARACGDNAITIWSWLLTLPFAVSVMAGYEFLRAGQPGYGVFLVALIVHVMLGGALLAARLTVLRPGRHRHRPVTAFLVFAAIGVARPLLALWLAASFGILVVPGDLLSRLTINLASAIVMLPLIAVVVDILREHGGVQRRLGAARTAVEERRADADRDVHELRSGFATAVAQRIDDAIGTVGSRLEAADAARLLRRISDDVVRPMSHELFRETGEPESTDDRARQADLPVRFGHRVRRVVSGLQPDPPIVITLVYLVLVVPHLLTTYGLGVAIIQAPVIGGIYLAGNTATFAISTRIASAAWRVVAIIACYTCVALLAALQTAAALGALGVAADFYWAEVASYPFIAVAIAVIRSVSVQLHSDEDALAASLREQVRLATRAQRRLTDVRRRLSHVLHSTVQAELIATSLSLQGGRGAEPDAAALVATTLADIKRELLSHSEKEPPGAREALDALLAMWGTVLQIELYVSDGAWMLLDEDPTRASAVVDALSEGLTNAVRHGSSASVALAIRRDQHGDALIVELRSEGPMAEPPQTAPGIGLAALRAVGSRVSIRSEDEHVVLTVVIA